MNGEETGNGIAILCDPQGIVQSVSRDDLDLASCIPPGQSVLHLADPLNAEKAREFFLALQSRPAVLDWEILVRWKGQLQVLHFSGSKIEGGFLVVAALSTEGMTMLYEEVMGGLKPKGGSLKAKADGSHYAMEVVQSVEERGGSHWAAREGDIYDDLSRVNNELANLQRDLSRKNAELARLDAQKTQFLGIAAHELRSPLSVILTYSEFLEEEAGLAPEQHEFVSVIKNSSEFLLRLINNLLDVSQIEAGKLNLDLAPTDLAALVRGNVALNRVLAEKKQIRMTLLEESPLPVVSVDPGKIEQVLYNLISNAVKFSKPQTEVSVRLGREGDQAVITVADQGLGIPEDQQAKLFKSFSRIKVKGSVGETGTGLGLWIVRRVVEGHHGTVRVKSVVGKGSTFQVLLPLFPKLDQHPSNSQ